MDKCTAYNGFFTANHPVFHYRLSKEDRLPECALRNESFSFISHRMNQKRLKSVPFLMQSVFYIMIV